MSTLKFVMDRGYIVTPLQEISISDADMAAYKDKLNKKYEPFIDRINADGAYFRITISNDGTKIVDATLLNVTAPILDEIQEYQNRKL